MDLAHPGALALLQDLLAGKVMAQFTVTGQSMRPFLVGGESVLLRRVALGEIRRGDLLLFRQGEQGGGRLLLHRVVSIRRRGQPALIQTQGDALWAPDEPVGGDQVLGRVCVILPDAPGAPPLRLDTPSQRARAQWIALRQRTLWNARRARSRLSRLAAFASRPRWRRAGTVLDCWRRSAWGGFLEPARTTTSSSDGPG
jgi:signal peptidase I